MADGSWHTITIEVHENVLQIFLDESKEGFDVEFSAVHNFMDSALDKVIIGGQGFRGCVTNFTLNNELQSLEGGIRQLLEANVPSGNLNISHFALPKRSKKSFLPFFSCEN